MYESLAGKKLPAKPALSDLAESFGLSKENLEECIERFVLNAKFSEVLVVLSGAERILDPETAIEHALSSRPKQDHFPNFNPLPKQPGGGIKTQDGYDAICFYIAPIGDEGSEFRKHSDLIGNSIVDPVCTELGLKLVRADEIAKAGIITKQVVEHILKAKMVIADLSYHNPNVFYELAIRHCTKKPTVQIIRKADKIPFDVNPNRTIIVDTTDIYSLVPNLETYKIELQNHLKSELKSDDPGESMIGSFIDPLSLLKN